MKSHLMYPRNIVSFNFLLILNEIGHQTYEGNVLVP